MNDQLVLLENDDDRPEGPPPRRDWVVDERTREIGRRGVALAREALRQAAARAA